MPCGMGSCQLLTNPQGIAGIVREGAAPLEQSREIRADQYGIRTQLRVDGQPIKLEIVSIHPQ